MVKKPWCIYILLPTCLPRDDTYAFHFAAIFLHENWGHHSSLVRKGRWGEKVPISKHKMMCLSLVVGDKLRMQKPSQVLWLGPLEWDSSPGKPEAPPAVRIAEVLEEAMWLSAEVEFSPHGQWMQSQSLGWDAAVGMAALRNVPLSMA